VRSRAAPDVNETGLFGIEALQYRK
jgi:hypothetical protein